jgi:beta-1,4-mannosyltransferase
MKLSDNSKAKIRVHHFPSSPAWRDRIIYVGKLLAEMSAQGIQIDLPDDAGGDYLTRRWLTGFPKQYDILHFHWTDYQYTGETFLLTLWRLLKYALELVLLRLRGYKIVWTMHNYLPHESRFPILNFIERWWMARCVHAVIVHAHFGKELLAKRLMRRHHVYVIPHGNYIPYFVRTPRLEARNKLGVPEGQLMLLNFGYIRSYKGVPEMLDVFRQLPDLDASLFVVGNAPGDIHAKVARRADLDRRVKTELHYVDDDQLALYLSAADAVILPYIDVLGSGALMTALTFGCPVIAPAIGTFKEILDEHCGILYADGRSGLKDALSRLPGLDLDQMSDAALARARQYPCDGMVRDMINVYAEVMGEK